jgi:hypothetical protein
MKVETLGFKSVLKKAVSQTFVSITRVILGCIYTLHQLLSKGMLVMCSKVYRRYQL